MVSENTNLQNEDWWESTTFEGSRREQLQDWARMTFTQKIEWMEEAQKIAMAFEKNRLARQTLPVTPISKGP